MMSIVRSVIELGAKTRPRRAALALLAMCSAAGACGGREHLASTALADAVMPPGALRRALMMHDEQITSCLEEA